MLQTLAIHGSREKGKVGTGTFFTTIVKFGEPMPRRRVPTRISDADARWVAGRLIFAAAAQSLGGVYGTVALERGLRFTPAARAQRQAERRASPTDPPSPKAKATLPTGTCKKWLEGHVPSEQTLALIADAQPKVAARMQQARDSDLVRALSVAKNDVPFVGRRIAILSPELWGEYLGCMALVHCSPDFVTRVTAGLLHLAMDGKGPQVLVAVIAADRQMPSVRGPAATRNLNEAFRIALDDAATHDPELAFAKEAITQVWARRRSGTDQIDTPPKVSQMFAANRSKLPKFATN